MTNILIKNITTTFVNSLNNSICFARILIKPQYYLNIYALNMYTGGNKGTNFKTYVRVCKFYNIITVCFRNAGQYTSVLH